MFLQPDWLRSPRRGWGTNYSYCAGDPVNCSDSTGNVPTTGLQRKAYARQQWFNMSIRKGQLDKVTYNSTMIKEESYLEVLNDPGERSYRAK
jgi:hypothetical protein